MDTDELDVICQVLEVSPAQVVDDAVRAVLSQQEQTEVSRMPAQNLYALAANHERRPEEDAQEADYF